MQIQQPPPPNRTFLKLYLKSQKQTELKQTDARARDQAQQTLKRKLETDRAYDEGYLKEDSHSLARPMLLILSDLKQEHDSRLVHSDIISHGRYHLLTKKQRRLSMREIGAYLSKQPLFQLFSWQEEAQAFIESRESDRTGIGSPGLMLCHDMGLGKTDSALYYLLYDNQRCFRQTGNRYNGCTLIVVPNKLVLEGWLHEVRTKFPPNTFEYYILQSSKNRLISRVYIENCCDFVIVTYATVNAAYRDKLNQEQQQVKEDLNDEEEQEEEEEEGEDDDLEIEHHYRSDILFNTRWKRIMADESHHFVNRNTFRYKAMMALQADIKWAITGTPIQNRLSDICSTFNFIGVPYSLMKENEVSEQEKARIKELLNVVMIRKLKSEINQRDNEMVMMPVVKTIKLIEFESLAEKVIYYLYATYGSRHWREAIETQDNRSRGVTYKSTNIASILQLMMQLCIGVRIVNDLVLPNGMLTLGNETQLKLKETQYKESVLPPLSNDRAVSYSQNDNTLEYFASHLSKRTLFYYKSNSDTVLTLADGYQLQYHASLSSEPLASLAEQESNDEQFEWDPFKKDSHFDLINCQADREQYMSLYQQLSQEGIEGAKKLMREAKKSHNHTKQAMLTHLISRVLREPHYSTKNRHIIKYIREQVPAEDKVIVFSNSIHSQECLQRDLAAHGIQSIIVNGTTRDNLSRIDLFKQSSPVSGAKVLILSLKLGNVGVNLICANHIIFLHQWWNPYIIQQAEDRVHRLGQLKVVYIVHFIMNHTIDLYVHNLAHNKKFTSGEIMSKHGEEVVSQNVARRIEDYAYNLYEYSITQER